MGILPLQHLRVGGLQTAGEAAHHRRAHNYLTDGVRRGTVTTACLLPSSGVLPPHTRTAARVLEHTRSRPGRLCPRDEPAVRLNPSYDAGL